MKFDRATSNIEIANWPRLGRSGPAWCEAIRRLAHHDQWIVLQVINQGTGEIVYTFRMKGNTFIPTVREDLTYTVKRNEKIVYKDRKPKKTS